MPGNIGTPATPHVTAASPTPSDTLEGGSYFAPITRANSKRTSVASGKQLNNTDIDEELEARARARSRSPHAALVRRRTSGLTPLASKTSNAVKGTSKIQKSQPVVPNGHLSPAAAAPPGSSFWRGISRSPSPLGLIPLHKQWRSFIHRHEVPRKVLHVSIGFVVLYLYTRGVQPEDIHPKLLTALVPIATVDIIRHQWNAFNELYIKVCGALMRENEVHDRYNGVIWYLLGAWVAMSFFPKDIGAISILLLSWSDTAASTVGRRWGRFTPRIRHGKSVAGTAAAFVVGVLTSILWWGYFVPSYFGFEEDMQYQGSLGLPNSIHGVLDTTETPISRVTGWQALVVVSIWSGIAASASEAVDIFNFDDNATIPILSGLALWAFLRLFE